jgi:hypothetical protein
MKTCTKCGESKLLMEFHKNKSKKNGLRNDCKSCAVERRKQYYQDNKEAIAEYKKQYYQDNKEAIVEHRKQYYQDNKEAIVEHNKQHYQDNKEKQPTCIYEIRNKDNNQVYVGQTTRGEMRWQEHKRRLLRGKHPNHNLQKDFAECGLESFEWNILQEFDTDNEKVLLKEEALTIQRYIREHQKLYNLTLTIEQLEMIER